MRIERTEDSELIRRIVTHPLIWDKISDDGADKKSYLPFIAPSVYWLSVIADDGQVLGMYFIHPHNQVCYEVHTCILPEAWGTKSKQAAKLLIKWVFTNTTCEKLMTNVPEDNPIALRYAQKAGLSVIGENTKSFKKNGVLMNQTILGIEKGEWLCQ